MVGLDKLPFVTPVDEKLLENTLLRLLYATIFGKTLALHGLGLLRNQVQIFSLRVILMMIKYLNLFVCKSQPICRNLKRGQLYW